MSFKDHSGRNLVFIVGCPRSGTTYLQKLLASHPKIHSGWESYIFAWYLGPLLRTWREKEHADAQPGEMRRMGVHSYLQEQEFRHLLKGFFDTMIGDLPEGDFFLEKTPAHSLWIREILDLFPDARFINIIRDGRDVVASLLAASKSWENDFTHYAFSAARLWTKYVRAVERARELVPKENFFDVRYEDLRRNPSEKLAMISRFLNLDWSEAAVREAVETNDIQQAMKTGGTQLVPSNLESATRSGAIYKYAEVSFIRKGEPGSWRSDLRFYQKWQVWLFAHKTMADLGYPWRYPW
jgi:hypothetical protein